MIPGGLTVAIFLPMGVEGGESEIVIRVERVKLRYKVMKVVLSPEGGDPKTGSP